MILTLPVKERGGSVRQAARAGRHAQCGSLVAVLRQVQRFSDVTG